MKSAACGRPKSWGDLHARGAASVAVVAVVAATMSIAASASAATTPKVPRLVWAGCGGGFECATATVPLDYSHPEGATISLALIRLPATDQAHRVGSLFVNPGGPGGSGVDFVRAAAQLLWAPKVRALFDIVGFDPRGVARSTPTQCFASNTAENRLIGSLPPFPVGRHQQVTFISTFEQFDGICLRRNATIMQHMATADVARDLDLLRQAVGDKALTYDGVSYGSYLGNTYANLFPQHVRALIIDGVLNPVEWATGTDDGFRVPFSTRLDSARGAYVTLLQFFSLCKEGGTSCAFSAGDPKTRYYSLLARARAHPIVVPGGPPVTFAEIVNATLGAMYDPASWPGFAQFLQQLDTSPSSAAAAFQALVATIAGTPTTPYNNGLEAFLGVACSDANDPHDPFVWPQAAGGQDEQFRYFGSAWTRASEPCSTWPAADSDRFTGPFNHLTSAPVLVIGNFFDPATPYQGAQAVADMLPRARLLSLDGWGHTSLGKSSCINSYVTAYLVAQELPPPRTVCRPDSIPFQTSAAPNGTAASTAVPSLVPAPVVRALPAG